LADTSSDSEQAVEYALREAALRRVQLLVVTVLDLPAHPNVATAGRHGAGGPLELLVGSTALRSSMHASCPVTVVATRTS
jgi:nucleotide-binding universal stress UspA family protein